MGRLSLLYTTNYRDIKFLLSQGAEEHPLVDLEAELGEVNYFVHGETRLDFLAWATH